MSRDLETQILGKRKSTTPLDMMQYEHVRNYTFSKQPNESKDDFVLEFDDDKKVVKFCEINQKLALHKKKKMHMMEAPEKKDFSLFIQVAQRALTEREKKKHVQKAYEEIHSNLKIREEQPLFEGRKELQDIEKQVDPLIKVAFSSQLKACEEAYKNKIKKEIETLKKSSQPEEQEDEFKPKAEDAEIEDLFNTGEVKEEKPQKKKKKQKRLLKEESDENPDKPAED